MRRIFQGVLVSNPPAVLFRSPDGKLGALRTVDKGSIELFDPLAAINQVNANTKVTYVLVTLTKHMHSRAV